MSATPPPHPGTILFVDENKGHEHARPVSEVPESLRFAPDQNGNLVPVVKVVARVVGEQRTIREYGTGGEMLRSTVQFRARNMP
ncbi:MAG TPA: hypothetical protein VFB81_19295 [Myxococcales bacterium]|nr:hypothetical protein [Myxococcales bacterium]